MSMMKISTELGLKSINLTLGGYFITFRTHDVKDFIEGSLV